MKYLFILCVMLLLTASCNSRQGHKKPETTTAAKEDTLAPVKVTVIATLPDSLQPKTVALDMAPKPLTVMIPKNRGGSYSKTNSKGEVLNIKLEPPVTKMLPVLQNDKGETIRDKDGNPFIMGDGGISNFTTFTTDNGLALDGVTCSIMDKTGNLWFGTDGGGVSRYDGKIFTNFTSAQGLANNNVLSMAEDSSGNIWIGTFGGGVSRYDGKSFTTFNIFKGLTNNTVWSIAVDRSGNLWFGTNGGGVSRYDGKYFTAFTSARGLANNDVRCIAVDNTGNLWFGTFGGGVSRYDGKSLSAGQAGFTTFTTLQGLANNDVRCIAEDKTGNLWFGTNGGGVSRLSRDGKSLSAGQASFTTFTSAQGLANNIVWSIAEDKTGNLWFGTFGGGVSRYEGKSLSAGHAGFTTFTSARGLANNTVLSITVDKPGNLWFGTFGGGVSRYEGRSFINFTSAQGLANNTVLSIAEDKTGHLWFGTNGGGVSRYDGQSLSAGQAGFTTFTSGQGLADNTVWSIAEDKSGNLWFGTFGGGVSRYDGQSLSAGQAGFTTFTTAQGLANNTVLSIAEDISGNLWFGTFSGGVSRYDGKSFTSFTTAQGLANNTVRDIEVDKTGNLWFGTNGGGVSRLSRDGKSFTSFTTAQGLADNTVLCIAQDKSGNLWFGTTTGLSVMSADDVGTFQEKPLEVIGKKSHSKNLFRTFTKTDGLPDNFITQVLQMPDGKMAVGTNLGITLFIPSGDLTSLTGIEIYNSVTDWPVKDVNTGQNCMFLDSKGIVWAGTGSEKTSLVRFDPSALHINNDAPILMIHSIKVNEENICWYDLSEKLKVKSEKFEGKSEKLADIITPAYITEEVTTLGKALTEAQRDIMRQRFGDIRFNGITKFYPLPLNLVLPYRHNNITIDFGANETGRPNMVSYQYILEGYDKEWSPVLKMTSAGFGNIGEGSYTFKVKARGPNGIWCEPVTYTFKVLPPWYRTWWAYLIYVLLFVMALAMFIKWRERNLRREKEKLEKKVDERTRELKDTQNQLVQQEKLASLGALTAGIAHEIKNPLNFVNNFAELSIDLLDELKSGKSEEEKDEIMKTLKQNMEKINHHGKRADGIVKSMLEHSRSNTGERQLTDINKLCDEYLTLAYHGMRANVKDFNCTIERHFAENLPEITIVPQDISRVLLNLINNAFYAIREKPGATLVVTTLATTHCLMIKIKDNGTGIPENIKQKIFEPFFTTKPAGSGTGLGLSLSFDIIKAHRGTIEVESEEGKGTEFIISLPLKAK